MAGLVPVTDPALLEQLNAPPPGAGPAGGVLTPVTDPELLAQLSAPHPTDQEVDRFTGAPLRTRAIVGGVPEGPNAKADRLATMRHLHPEAVPLPDDPNNFMFRHPETGQWTLFRPDVRPAQTFGEGVANTLERVPGVIAEHGRDIATMAGMTGGGALGGAGGAVPGGIAGAALGGEGAGQLYDIGTRLLGRQDSRDMGQALGDAATNTAINATAETGGRALLGGLKASVETGKRALDYATARVEPLLADVTGSPAIQWLTNAASSIVTSAGAAKDAAMKSLNQLEEAVSRNVGRAGTPMSREGAGTVLQEAGENTINRFKVAASTRYGEVDRLIPKDTPVSVTNYDAALERLRTSMPDAQATAVVLQSPLTKQLFDALQKDATATGTLSWQSVTGIRSRIGEMLADPMMLADTGRAEVKAIYGALSKDLEAAAQAKGPDALAKFQEASDFYRAGINAIDQTWDKLLKAGVTPERAYASVMNTAKDGGTMLERIKAQVTPTEWGVLRATALNSLGNDGKAELPFEAGRFLRNWRNLSEEAKGAFFDSPTARGDFDRLARISEMMKDTAALANTSKTAGTVFAIGLLTAPGAYVGSTVGGGSSTNPMTGQSHEGGSVGGAVAGAAAGLVAPWAAAKLLTSPQVVRWMLTPASSGDLSVHLSRLAAIGVQNTELRPAIEQYLATAAAALGGMAGQGASAIQR